MTRCAVGGELSGIVGPCISYGALLQCTVLVPLFQTTPQLNSTPRWITGMYLSTWITSLTRLYQALGAQGGIEFAK